MEFINAFFGWVSAANEALWGCLVLWLLVAVSIALTVRLGFFQFWRWRTMFASMRGERKEVRSSGAGISSFQAFCVSLGARVGTGNLAGGAAALKLTTYTEPLIKKANASSEEVWKLLAHWYERRHRIFLP